MEIFEMSSHKINYDTLKDKVAQEYLPYKLDIGHSIDKFLTIRETLSRIGRLQDNKSSKKSLWQVCSIVQDELTDNYYLVHFKHLYILSGKESTTEFKEQDFDQLNYIARLISSWGLAGINEDLGEYKGRCNISVIPYKDKERVNLRKKFYVKSKDAE